MNQNKSNNKNADLLLLINFAAVIVLFVTLVLNYHSPVDWVQNSINLGTELVGSFIVTFLGVYISFTYAKKQEAEKEKRNGESVYVNALKLLASELNLNKAPLETLAEALEEIPLTSDKYYDNFGFLVEMTKDIKSDVFYSLISSGALEQISKSDAIFNGLQQTYYNLFKTITGLSLIREVFRDPPSETPQQILLMASKLKTGESAKIKKAIDILKNTEQLIMKELNKFDVTFTEVV